MWVAVILSVSITQYKSADQMANKLNKLLPLILVVENQVNQLLNVKEIGVSAVFFALDLESDVAVSGHSEGTVDFSRVVYVLEESLLRIVVEVDYSLLEVKIEKTVDCHHYADLFQLGAHFDVDVVLFED
jgi:hypothetical protein